MTRWQSNTRKLRFWIDTTFGSSLFALVIVGAAMVLILWK